MGALTLSVEPLKLRSTKGDVHFGLAHSFRMVEEAPKVWHVSTVAYDYRLDDADGRELISWHWHPTPLPGVDFPHLHVSSSALDRHAHIPTGRVSIESILRLLLTDFGVHPTREHRTDYLDVLDASEQLFVDHRRWHA
ncbi:hypothetical protein [Tenggerimyces flavus]|uniref:Uncharacterized protein n=1 Tax=Tenggerimyces flavus TaxID=1708749 RepID=A0ABV7Y467_9ACTN|nr:hypothetical protein [Tenggerimyces flavus]MBM7788412.1 hypothetical protein [Tenggerimyces flavus]